MSEVVERIISDFTIPYQDEHRGVHRPELPTCQICYPKNAPSRAVSSVLVSQSGGTWGALVVHTSICVSAAIRARQCLLLHWVCAASFVASISSSTVNNCRSVGLQSSPQCQICYPKNALSRAVSSVSLSQSGGRWELWAPNTSTRQPFPALS